MINAKHQLENEIKELIAIDDDLGCMCRRLIHPITGLDVVGLDERLQTPDGISMNEYIQEKYGQRALEIIHKMATTYGQMC